MKRLTLFLNTFSADGFKIINIPWVSYEKITLKVLFCLQTGKELKVINDNIEIVDALPPNDEIWYTSSNGIINPYQASSLPEIDTNTYSDGKGVIKFKTDVTNIGGGAFYGCTGLTSVTIPNSVTSIGESAFSGCSGLASVTLPVNIESVGSSAFSGCYNIETYYYEGISTEWLNVQYDDRWYCHSFNSANYIHCLGDNVDCELSYYFCCFVAGTLILLPNNITKNIEDIKQGDLIISYNPTTDELYTTTVKNIIIHENTTTLARVTLANGLTVEMNEYHPLLTKNGWHSITNYEGYDTLIIGDEVKTLNGYSEITNIERWINEPITTYNLDVVDALGRDREWDNYFANSMCVHNPPRCN